MMKVPQMKQSGQKIRGPDIHAVGPGLNFVLNLHKLDLSSVVPNPAS